ncbi:hypothetical protein SDRG_11395 [Saprolegnia diclina VS20]|uniref:Ricin B lectin domain-containing protein n=1 Tax=Saprolegnia diclina (strain VS20) TaxID=1156394 RepID=T0Q8H2_SAPDV|nr:hypothetical protein SDRG_11395 [Saprolegnia diclina VS20]EQC30916.1 hypothetical protein SDRG_11395 [Saprolegnia diclina VS20]|eukprot:XP_008615654.1 hypothetical protein SDRG_11395 [Saprolegnia diclina VS20]
MKCVLFALVAAVAAAPIKLCTINRNVLSEDNKVLYTGKRCVSDNPMFDYDPATKLLKSKDTNRCLKIKKQEMELVTAPCEATDSYQRWELGSNRVKSAAVDRCLKASTEPDTAVTLAKCDLSTSLKSNQFLADCDSVESTYLTITPTVGKLLLSEFDGSLYADKEVKNLNELFVWDHPNGMLKSASKNQCLDAYSVDKGKFKLHTYACDVNNSNQKWNYDQTTKTLKHATHAGQCLDVDPSYKDHHVQMWECTPNNLHQQFTIAPYKP